jgi:hypothetical protein
MTTTTIYDPSIQENPLAGGFLTYLQLPTTPIYIQPFPPASISSITDVYEVLPLAQTTSSDGVSLTTSGEAFQISPGYNPLTYFLTNGATKSPTGRNLTLTANEGYTGFTNYTLDLDLASIDPLTFDINSIDLIPVNPAFPILNPATGFSITFDLAITEEQSNANRAGFNVTVISNDLTKGVELGFKENGESTDYVFIQNANLNNASAGENSSAIPLEISANNQYTLTFQGDTYSLFANGNALLTGQLRDYVFDPTNSDPPLPSNANPYETQNLLFFGDNTDQGYSTFTLGEIVISPLSTNNSANPDIPDFNGDGKADIIWRDSNSGSTLIWQMDGTDPQAGLSLDQLPIDWDINALGDFDKNGTQDLVWRNGTTAQTVIWFMDGTQSISQVELSPAVPSGWQVEDTADFDGDGHVDLLWRDQNTGQNTIWLMDGTTPKSAVSLLAVSNNWQVGGVADFDNDSNPDILWRDTVTGQNRIWLMNKTAPAASVETLEVFPEWFITGVADFNQDDNPDIFWRNSINGENRIWIMDQSNPIESVSLTAVTTNWAAIV